MAHLGKTLNVLLARIATLILFAVAATCAPALAEGWQHLGTVQHVEKLPDGVELSAGTAKVRITAFRDGVIRVRVAPQGAFPKDFSWAVIETSEVPPVRVEDAKDDVRLLAGSVNVIIHKSPLLISFSDSQGRVVLEDEPTLPMASNGRRIRIWKKMPVDESYFGLGDKAGPMNRRGRSFTNWNVAS
jgi:alpha-glucosidase